MIVFQDRFPTEKNCKELIIHSISESLSAIDAIPQIDHQDLKLIVDEALHNAMEHGNRWDPGKNILIKIKTGDDFVEVTIKDEGEGFDFSGRIQTEDSGTNLNMRGRGILLIRKLCDSQWINNGNTLKINIPLASLSGS